MTLVPNLDGCRVWVAGAARSGIGAAQILKNLGASVFVSDSASIPEESKTLLQSLNIEFEENGHSFDQFELEAKLLVISPAILLDRGLALHARKHKIPIVSEIEVTSWIVAHSKICGITGTNGKSTTTHYLAQLLDRGGLKGVACGNIGKAFSVATKENSDATFAVELSSYQLESTYSLRPKTTILLNLQLDHQARYENLDDYLKAKWRIVLLTADDGIACIDSDCFEHAVKMGLPLPRAQVILLNSLPEVQKETPEAIVNYLRFGQNLPVALYHDLRKTPGIEIFCSNTFGYAIAQILSDRSLKITVKSETIDAEFHVRTPCLPGEHNAKNILAASVAALAMGVSVETIRVQWEHDFTQYQHLAHRLENIGDKNSQFLTSEEKIRKVAIVNDSKATNVESVIVALKSYDKPLRVLVGGDPKGESFAPLAAFVGKRVIKFYPFGKAGQEIFDDINPIASKHVAPVSKSLFDAAQTALNESNDGEIILLSPSCASFDEFKNFEHRGDMFRTWAKERLVSGENPS